MYKATGSLCDCPKKKEVTSLPSAFNTIINEEIQAKDELLVCIYTNTLKENLTLKYQ